VWACLFSWCFPVTFCPLLTLSCPLPPLVVVACSGPTKEAHENARLTRAEAALTKGKSHLRAELNKVIGAAESAKAPAKKNTPKAPASPKKSEAKKTTAAAASKKRKAEEEPAEAEAAAVVRALQHVAFFARARLPYLSHPHLLCLRYPFPLL